jgi:hypothetical protein
VFVVSIVAKAVVFFVCIVAKTVVFFVCVVAKTVVFFVCVVAEIVVFVVARTGPIISELIHGQASTARLARRGFLPASLVTVLALPASRASRLDRGTPELLCRQSSRSSRLHVAEVRHASEELSNRVAPGVDDRFWVRRHCE